MGKTRLMKSDVWCYDVKRAKEKDGCQCHFASSLKALNSRRNRLKLKALGDQPHRCQHAIIPQTEKWQLVVENDMMRIFVF
jgi:hypothetical protein